MACNRAFIAIALASAIIAFTVYFLAHHPSPAQGLERPKPLRPCNLSFASVFMDGAVLQQGPGTHQVWGFTDCPREPVRLEENCPGWEGPVERTTSGTLEQERLTKCNVNQTKCNQTQTK